jgi:RimJ/RimL family protein N-acetyltransferase
MTAHLSDTPVLETDRLTLRAPQASDFEVFAPFVMSDRARFVGGGADKTLGQAWRILAVITGHWQLRGWGMFVIVDTATGAPLGAAGPWMPADWPEPELSWTIWTAKAEGRGYAHEAVTEVRRHAYDNLGWPTAVSYIDERNDRSIALARRLGCTPDAQAPRPNPDEPLQVWRHPAPETLQ